MGISRPSWRTARAAALGTLVLLAAGACGASAKPGPFSWLKAQAPPRTSKIATVASGAQLAYPPTWHQIHGDAGTATAVLMNGGQYLGYLNVTPRQGDETLAGWASFRVQHNGEEGDVNVKRLASATGLRFLNGSGSCVKDSYTTKIGAHFIEVACLVVGPSRTSVVVAAAPPASWAQMSPTLERAISGFRA